MSFNSTLTYRLKIKYKLRLLDEKEKNKMKHI